MLTIRSFRTRVAKRIIMLFFACSLFPILAITSFSYAYIKSQLLDQNKARLVLETKSIATSIYERLILLQNEIGVLLNNVWHDSLLQGPQKLEHPHAPLSHNFSKIGFDYDISNLGSKQIDHLQTGNPLLLISNPGSQSSGLNLLVYKKSTNDTKVTVNGEIRGEYLWAAAERLSPGNVMFIMDASNNLLYGSDLNVVSSMIRKSASLKASHTGLFEWSHNHREYLGSYTTLFLKSNFYYPYLKITIGVSKDTIYAPVSAFKYVFPILIGLMICLVLLLSMRLIHKNLTPIESLQLASQKIAGGDLNSRVVIDSKDEFEDLGRTFNQMSEKLQKSQSLLIRRSKLETMGQLTAGLAHEIKQPLTAIHGHVGLMQMKHPKDDPNQATFTIIIEAINRITQLMDRFGSMAAPTKDDMQPLSIENSVKKVESLFKHQIANARIQIHTEYQQNLPHIPARENDIIQILSNLLINAMHAMESKTDNNRNIFIVVYCENSELVIIFEDTGCGIPSDIQEQIFNPFFTTKSSEKGTGLGMAIVESILHSHKAHIVCDSKVGVGTRFTLRFPIPPHSGENKHETRN